MFQEDPLFGEFLNESREHLANIEMDLLAMEEAGAHLDMERVNKVFRAAHTIKGGAGFFNLENIQKLAHRAESILVMMRNREMVPTPEVVNQLLLAFDRLKDMVNHPSECERMEIQDLLEALMRLASAHLSEEEKKSLNKTVPQLETKRVQLSQFDLMQASHGGKNIFLLDIDLLNDIQGRGKNPWEVFKFLMGCGSILDCAWDFEAVGTLESPNSSQVPMQMLYATIIESKMLSELLGIPLERVNQVPVTLAIKPQELARAQSQNKIDSEPPLPVPGAGLLVAVKSEEKTLRVNVEALDQLMDLAGEMVLGRNQLLAAVASHTPRAILTATQRINTVTSEFQEAIMLVRMQPMGRLLDKFPRVVRDLAREQRKEINLQISGREVEIDRSLLEGLGDPLIHMIRNAADHGIEPSAERVAAGKSAAGRMEIRVYYEAGQVVIEILDDGRGLNVDRITSKALEKGQVTAEQVKGMSLKEKMALIFLPGLSTAQTLTNISGRGVGMDVVKTNLEKLRGTIDIESEFGKGSTFRIKLPLTLAILPSLLVAVEGERFAIPEINVSELISVAPDQVKDRIEVVGDTEVLLLRGQLIPLVRLTRLLHMAASYVDPGTRERHEDRRQHLADRRSRHNTVDGIVLTAQSFEGESTRQGERRQQAASTLNIVVVNAGTLQYGIVVEELQDTVEIVVKPLGRHLKFLKEYAGATILGDGSVALILDTANLAAMAGLISQGGSVRAAEVSQEHNQERLADRYAFLLFDNAPGEGCAVPLEQVDRVEKVDLRQVENLGGRRSMQYRGGSLPLLTLQDVARVGRLEEEQQNVVIVFTSQGREWGLLGALPVDSLELDVSIDQHTHVQPGIVGSAIVKNRTTLVLDIHELVVSALSTEPAGKKKRNTASSRQHAPTLLLVEDSEFFRNQLKKYLESGGYKVVQAEDGESAWAILANSAQAIHGVVSDIEMPFLNGFELVQRIRSDPRFQDLPVIAVTSLAGEEDILRGKQCGFSDYQIKLDKERLLESLHRHIAINA